MSEEINCTYAFKKLPTFLVKKNNLKPVTSVGLLKRDVFREDLLYESKSGDFLKLDTPLTLVNRFNLITKNSITVARYTKTAVEKTSENITRIIGQNNYDTVFSALCSVINHELKIRGILSLLTLPKKTKTVSCQTEERPYTYSKSLEEKETQTTQLNIIKNKPVKRTKRKQFTPYVVTESPKKKIAKKVVVYPNHFNNLHTRSEIDTCNSNKIETPMEQFINHPLSDFDDNSMDSKFSIGTVGSIPGLLEKPLSFLENTVDTFTAPVNANKSMFDLSNNTELTLLDGTKLRLPFKIEDEFHIATPDIMKLVSLEDRRKLLWYQAYIDWKNCLTHDEEDHLPIHMAAMNGDIDLLRRQCFVLKARHESVDIPTKENLSALQISIFSNNPQCTSLLLQHGADVLVTDDEYRTSFHLAAEADPGHLKALIKHCQDNPIQILQENDELWKPELASKPKDYLIKYLLRNVLSMFDNQGYTPLMLASKLGKFENVRNLIDASLETIDIQMPNSGNTALYLAVGSAYTDSENRGNKSVVTDDFKNTIELLVEHGADPAIENHSSSSVNTLLTDMRISELSMIIANKMVTKNCNAIGMADDSHLNIRMIIKGDDGKLDYKEMPQKMIKREKINKNNKDKPIIIQNVKIENNDMLLKQINTPTCSPVKGEIEKKCEIVKKDLGSDNIKKSPILSVQVEDKATHKKDYIESFKKFVIGVNSNKIVTPITDSVGTSTSSKSATTMTHDNVDNSTTKSANLSHNIKGNIRNVKKLNEGAKKRVIKIISKKIEIGNSNVNSQHSGIINILSRKRTMSNSPLTNSSEAKNKRGNEEPIKKMS
ncbi:unnamed protein product [Diatraea saccharalis]|uniref:Uncharacterized protein n=1 Tax=Diatraea saccharalis TaxID=40085 RepID=A0A9N9WIH1_9NEOP|nr:unnamed protein product [Diatraea saccharalis]